MGKWLAQRRDALIDNALAPFAPVAAFLVVCFVVLPFAVLPPYLVGVLAALAICLTKKKLDSGSGDSKKKLVLGS